MGAHVVEVGAPSNGFWAFVPDQSATGNCSSVVLDAAFSVLGDFFHQPPQEALACTGRLNLCSKTRELTDNQPKYIYRRQSVYNSKGGVTADGGGRDKIAGGGGGGKEAGRGWGGEGDTAVGREAGGAAGASYQDAGDRLYSEWKEARRRHARRQNAGAAQETASPEGWSCPQCGADNRQERRHYI